MQAKLPDTRIVYWPMTPSIARLTNWEREKKGNQLIKEYIDAGKNLVYIDSAEATLGPDGKPRAELFKPDGLHFNAEGLPAVHRDYPSVFEVVSVSGQQTWSVPAGDCAAICPHKETRP